MSSMLVASVAASTSSTKGSPKHREMSVVEENGVLDRENLLQRENLAKSQEEHNPDGDDAFVKETNHHSPGEMTSLVVPPWHAAARHASLCAVDLSVGVRSRFFFAHLRFCHWRQVKES